MSTSPAHGVPSSPPGVAASMASAAAAAARTPLWRDPHHRARALRAVASALDARCSLIIGSATADTALTPDELFPEFARTTGTLRMFADLLSGDAWQRPIADPPAQPPRHSVGPNHDLRRILVPIGHAAAVFGASNFPLAYGVCGGDTAGALAAGLGVVVKAHPAHPTLGPLIAETARAALAEHGVPDILCHAPDDEAGDFAVARTLVTHPDICAVGFTGSRSAGLAIEAMARARPRPIPVFAEMSGVNPVLVTARALEERAEEIGTALAASLLMRHGQQCTCPGVLLLDGPPALHAPLLDVLAELVRAHRPRRMLSPRVERSYRESIARVEKLSPDVQILARGREEGRATGAILFSTTPKAMLAHEALREELFGPAMLVLPVDSSTPRGVADLRTLLAALGGQLTASIFLGSSQAHTPDDTLRCLIDAMAAVAGRIIINGVPTGVRVAPAMVHGGPFPATNRPDTTAVGAASLERWCRPLCLQNWPRTLPAPLQDAPISAP